MEACEGACYNCYDDEFCSEEDDGEEGFVVAKAKEFFGVGFVGADGVYEQYDGACG